MDAESGFEIKPVYDAATSTPANRRRARASIPYTRGVYPTMYTERPWTMRQYAGFGTAAESNARYHQLLAAGTMGLSVAFDLPTQMGYDSDDPIAHGEVGKVGVAIDSIDDMRRLFDGIPLDKVSTSMTINAPGSVLLLLYQLVAEEQGVPGTALNGHDPERHPEGVHRPRDVHLPAASRRCGWSRTRSRTAGPRSRSGTRSRSPATTWPRPGATPAQEIAFTLANGIEYVRAAVAAGLAVDDFAPRLSFFFVARTTLLEEVAKFRAARRIWARIMRDEFGAKDPKSLMLRFHTQTAGVQLTAQQPEVNLVRVAIQALGAVVGGTQSLHTNSYDEAHRPAHREVGPAGAADPAGARVRERADRHRRPVRRLVRGRGDDRRGRGGRDRADRAGLRRTGPRSRRSSRASRSRRSRRRRTGSPRRSTPASGSWSASTASRIDEEEPYEPLRVDPAIEAGQAARLAALRAERDGAAVEAALGRSAQGRRRARRTSCRSMREALRLRATVGEVCHTLRGVWGVYHPVERF